VIPIGHRNDFLAPAAVLWIARPFLRLRIVCVVIVLPCVGVVAADFRYHLRIDNSLKLLQHTRSNFPLSPKSPLVPPAFVAATSTA